MRTSSTFCDKTIILQMETATKYKLRLINVIQICIFTDIHTHKLSFLIIDLSLLTLQTAYTRNRNDFISFCITFSKMLMYLELNVISGNIISDYLLKIRSITLPHLLLRLSIESLFPFIPLNIHIDFCLLLPSFIFANCIGWL